MCVLQRLESAKRRSGETAQSWRIDFAIFVIVALFILLGFALFGCAAQTRYVGTPSTEPVKTSIENAQAANEQARSRVQRIEDKTIVIDRYWKQ